MLTVFVGQVTFAFDLPCQMDIQDQSTMMDHSSHKMGEIMDESNQSFMADCCEQNGSCSMSGCLSLGLPFLFQESQPIFGSESAERQIQFVIREFSSSLFRPPILS